MAAPKDRPKFGPFFILGVFFALFIGLPSSWKIITQSAFDEFQAPIWEITSRISDLSNYWGHQADSKKTLISKNRDLARIRADWTVHENNKENWENEISRLKDLRLRLVILQKEIGIDPEVSFQPIIARVTHRNLSAWWQELSLRKGTNQKVYPGMGVVFSHGIVGRIKQSGFNASKVELSTNPNFRIVAHFQGDDRPVTFQGDGILPGGKPMGVVLDVPHDITIEKNKPLLLKTSALGGTFPSGLHIGTVRMLEESGDGLFKNGKVILHKDLGKVPEVLVLRPTLPQIKQD